MISLLLSNLVLCSVRIFNTKMDEASLLLNHSGFPYTLILEYPDGVAFDQNIIKDSKIIQVDEQRRVYRTLLKINKKTIIKYKKYLNKSYQYDLYYEKGIRLRFWIIRNNKVEYGELLDWAPIPDLSMIFVGSLSLGIVLSVILKVIKM
ncbi:putative SP-containing membrane protein [Vairimorpha necatrix]|uniref:SP-containing membrane protein n=1 Tax=Vairimorpha necatrix TaxID=6039 RepID=A0AAX4JD21_9MICR